MFPVFWGISGWYNTTCATGSDASCGPVGCGAACARDKLSASFPSFWSGCRPVGEQSSLEVFLRFMAIQVTCPNCLKRFQVSDKFAGKSGPCPNCKKKIKVPDKDEEVVIHTPDDGAPKDRSGQSVLKPIVREETDVTRRGLFVTIGIVLFAIVVAIVLRSMYGGAPLWAQWTAAILLAPPLVSYGYSFARDQELAPYVGPELRNRVLILSAIFAALWLIYAFAPTYVMNLDQANHMSYAVFGITFGIMVAIGAIASVATFELEFINGIAHAGMYLIVLLALALISGVVLMGVEPPPTLGDSLRGLGS